MAESKKEKGSRKRKPNNVPGSGKKKERKKEKKRKERKRKKKQTKKTPPIPQE